MSVTIATRADITPDAVRRVAWDGEDVALAPAALEQMDRAHRSFTAFVEARIAEDPGALIYGTTTAPGDGAAVALTPEAQARRPTRLWTAHAFGAPLPDRVVRAIVLARPANFLAGHAAAPSAGARAVGGRARRGRDARRAAARGAVAGQRRRGRDRRARPAVLRPQRADGPAAEGAHGADQRLAVRGRARHGRRARRAGAPPARRERARARRRGRARAARGIRPRPRRAVGRRARDGRAAVAARAPRRRRGRPSGPPGRRELPHPAPRARPGPPRAGR